MQLIQRVREYMGWCPHSAAFRAEQPQVPAASFASGSEALPGSGTAAPGGGETHYRHTQIGTIQVWASIAAIIIIALFIVYSGLDRFILVATIVFLGGAILLFGSLTVQISKTDLRILFGPFGIINRIVPLADIRAVKVVTTPWYYGWGIRWTPEGKLYNIAGTEGVEVTLTDGIRFRIGTDEPNVLLRAITSVMT